MSILATTLLSLLSADSRVTVHNRAELVQAVSRAKPGDTILLAPGQYEGGASFSNVHGTANNPIIIRAADPKKPPVFEGGGSALQFSQVTYLEIRDLVIEKPRDNGLNIDDGGKYDASSHHVTVRNVRISDLPKGNHDGIKLSGLDDFRIEDCTVERWGGSAVDMVGCHRGILTGNTFRLGGDSGVQCKGGSANIKVQRCRFEEFGERGVNVGGSTGLEFFRPPIRTIPAGQRCEAKSITVEGCTFSGGIAPIAFVGVDGAAVRFNTISNPDRWAIRILQETNSPDFIPSRNGAFEDNLIVFRSDRWSAGGVNIGGGTSPTSFRFARNFWYCSDRPTGSKPNLPTPENNGVYGQDPKIGGDLKVAVSSPARKVGAHAFRY
jgi:hypothetical protein